MRGTHSVLVEYSRRARQVGFYDMGAFLAVVAYWAAVRETAMAGPWAEADSLFHLAQCLLAHRSTDEGLIVLAKCIRLAERDGSGADIAADAHETLARVAMSESDYAFACECLARSLTFDVTGSTSYFKHSLALSYARMRADGRPRYAAALDLEAMVSWSDRGHAHSGDVLHCQGIHAFHARLRDAYTLLQRSREHYVLAGGERSAHFLGLLDLSIGGLLLERGETQWQSRRDRELWARAHSWRVWFGSPASHRCPIR